MRPVTDHQWQQAVDAAYLMQQIELARLFGLLPGWPEVDLEKCSEILADGRELGIRPRLEQLINRLAAPSEAPAPIPSIDFARNRPLIARNSPAGSEAHPATENLF